MTTDHSVLRKRKQSTHAPTELSSGLAVYILGTFWIKNQTPKIA